MFLIGANSNIVTSRSVCIVLTYHNSLYVYANLWRQCPTPIYIHNITHMLPISLHSCDINSASASSRFTFIFNREAQEKVVLDKICNRKKHYTKMVLLPIAYKGVTRAQCCVCRCLQSRFILLVPCKYRKAAVDI